MVKFLHIILLIFSLLLPLNSLAAKFEASVDTKNVTIGEGLTLSLTLSDTKPKSTPLDAALKKDFTVQGKAQTASTRIINGNTSSQIGWQYNLIPKHKGEIEIPAITIDTETGQLSTKPIKIKVSTSSNTKESTYQDGVSVASRISKKDPYTNETIIYTVEVTSYYNLSDLHSSHFEINDTIFEPIGSPVINQKVIDGYDALVITYKYRLTPLKAGQIEMPSHIMTGLLIDKNIGSRWGGFYRDDVDQFDIFGNVNRFGSLSSRKKHKFKISTKPIILNVQEVPQEHNALIRAEDLQINENFDEKQLLKQGEPLMRSFTIRATGTIGNQIPSLDGVMNIKEEEIKIYPDLPTINDQIKDDKQIGQRIESYTLIPQKSGKITLPEISIPWWNVKTKQVEYAKVPSRILNISAGVKIEEGAGSNVSDARNVPEQNAPQENRVHYSNAGYKYIIWALFGAISIAIIIAFMVSLRRAKNQQRLEAKRVNNNFVDEVQVNISYKDALKTSSALELRDFLQQYANCHFDLPKYVPLEEIFESIKGKMPVNMTHDISKMIKDIQGNLYAGQEIDIEATRAQCANILKIATKLHKASRKNSVKKKDEELPGLNPE